VLVHHADATSGGVEGIHDLAARAVDVDRSLVGHHEPDEDLHQRRLAGAVLAEDAVDPAAMEAQVDAVARDDGTEALGDGGQLDRRGRRGHALADPVRSTRSRVHPPE
jgi:hypothetical protein